MLNPHENAREWPAGAHQLHVVEDGLADMIAFGTNFIANPDLVQRLRTGMALAVADESTFYLGDGHGYTDYPVAATPGNLRLVDGLPLDPPVGRVDAGVRRH